MVVAQGLGDERRQAARDAQSNCRLAVVMHRMWLDGTEFRWTRENHGVSHLI